MERTRSSLESTKKVQRAILILLLLRSSQGCTQGSFIRGGSPPQVQTFTLLYNNFDRKVNPFIYF